MLLAIDIGNSNIKFGVFEADQLLSKFSIPTDRSTSTRALSSAIRDQIPAGIKFSIICSVVPEVNKELVHALAKLGISNTAIIDNNIELGLGIDYEPLSDLGTDRLMNAYAACEMFGAPCIVCSLGTALTIDFVSKDRQLLGGMIAPGMLTMAKSLRDNTSRLPEINAESTDPIIQNTTIGSIKSGVFYGFVSQFDGLIRRVKDEIGEANVIATGGTALLIADHTDSIDVIEPDLLLFGLNRAYQKNYAT